MGATGFIGSHVAEQFKLAGCTVTALIRNFSDYRFLRELRVDLREIDFDNADQLQANLSNADLLINGIAYVKIHQRYDGLVCRKQICQRRSADQNDRAIKRASLKSRRRLLK